MKLPSVAGPIAAVRLAVLSTVLVLVLATLATLALGGCKSDPAEAPKDFCYVARSSNLSCKEPSDCDAQFGAICASLPLALSPTSLAATRSCLESGVCGVATCIARSAKSAVPTEAHLKLAEDFCKFCAPSLKDCQASFYKRSSKSAGLTVLAYSEDVVTAIDDACTGQDGCQAKFQSCATGVIKDKVGTDVDSDTAECIVNGFKQDDGETPLGPDGKPQVATCTAANCTGCCRDDKCEKGDDVAGCGASAKACEICSGAAVCLAGKCKEPCGPNNCAGCCNGDSCVTGISDSVACGEKGVACTRCEGTLKCSNHSCIETSCLQTCQSGCCTSAGCQPGTAAKACGTGGEGCTDCGAGRKCAAAVCSLDTTSLWDIVISSAFVPEKDKKGAAWDLLNGAPDPYLDIFTSEGTSSHSGGTLEDRDTTFAVWLETPLKGVKASEIIKSTSIEVWDYDDEITNDDFMGGCKVPITAAMFTGTLQFYTCPVTATGGAIDLAFKLVPHVP